MTYTRSPFDPWQTVLAVDFDKWAAATYAANFPGVDVRCGPVSEHLDSLPDCDVILGGPPCPPFSHAGKRKGHKDERDCIPDFVEAVGKVRPRQFLMEQVDGLLSGDAMPYYGAIIRAFEVFGYVVDYRLLDAVNFGVPQFRLRVWTWGMRKDVFDAKANKSHVRQGDPRGGGRRGRDVSNGKVDSRVRGVRGGDAAKHVEDAASSRCPDAAARAVRCREPLLARWTQRAKATAETRAVSRLQSREARDDAARTLREVRRTCRYVAGPSRRLLQAVRRALVVSGVPSRGALRPNVMPWPKPTHAWPPPSGESLFGASLLPGVTVGQALGLDGMLHRKRGKGMLERAGERRDHPTTEPSPAITSAFALGGGGGLFIIGGSHAQNVSEVSREGEQNVRSRHAPMRAVRGNREDKPEAEAGLRGVRPSPVSTEEESAVVEYRWSDAMLAKHPPASPASPAPTVQAKYFKGGAEGFLRVDDPKHPVNTPDRPAVTQRGGGSGHSAPDHTTLLAVDAPAHTISGQSREPIQNFKGKGYVRRLLPLECARLQSVHDGFVWPEKITKTAMYKVVGNGWASLMGWRMSQSLSAADPDSRTVVDLFCGGGLGAAGWHGRFWSYQPEQEEAA